MDRTDHYRIKFRPNKGWTAHLYFPSGKLFFQSKYKYKLLNKIKPFLLPRENKDSSCKCPECKKTFEKRINRVEMPEKDGVYLVFCRKCKTKFYDMR